MIHRAARFVGFPSVELERVRELAAVRDAEDAHRPSDQFLGLHDVHGPKLTPSRSHVCARQLDRTYFRVHSWRPMALTFSPQRLRKARLRKSWSQADLAYALKTSEKNVGRWERGENVPRMEAVAAIAVATGHALEFFLVDGDAEDDDQEAALRKQASDVLAPFSDRMVDVLLAECRAHVASRGATA